MKIIIPFSFVCLIYFSCIAAVIGQNVSLITDPSTHQQQLQIESESAGLISIRGDKIIGIDWNAPGKATIAAPFVSYNQSAGEQTITINGKPVKINTNPVDQTEKISPGVINPYVYIPTYGWHPGQPFSVRRNILIGAVASVLIFLALLLTIKNRKFLLSAALGVSLIFAGFFILSPSFHRVELQKTVRIKDQNYIEWKYLSYTKTGRYETNFYGQNLTILFPQSETHLRRLDPVLVIAEKSYDNKLAYLCAANDPVAIYQSLLGKSWAKDNREESEKIISPELIRKVYGRDYVVENNVMVLKPITPAATKPSESR